MDEYKVSLTERAMRDLDSIYIYIAETVIEPKTASELISEIESGIFSLDQMPHRCLGRRTGVYANRGYRQLFVNNYTILYRIDEEEKRVIVVTVRHSQQQF